VLQKADVGGVHLHLRGAAAVKRAAEKMVQAVGPAAGVTPTGFVIQRMTVPGVELLVSVVNDPQFGPTVASARAAHMSNRSTTSRSADAADAI
jgi:acyl-CoA synthetase (NDP forming)